MRWADIPADSAMANPEMYPLKHALEAVGANDGPILEAGCGAGRIVRYFHNHGYEIIGIDFIEAAIEKLRSADCTLKVEVGDITKLHFPDGSFRYLLAFGLYHGLEDGLERSLAESLRVLMVGGRICASFRADNLSNRLSDWLVNRRERCVGENKETVFHKFNLTRREVTSLFERAGFVVDSIRPVQNMPLLYKFVFFRAREHKRFDENTARAEGYRLSPFGQWLQNLLMQFFPDQACNVYVLNAHKP